MSKRQADRINKRRREKRGVVLLVVVSILTLFLMVGVTYVLIAGHYHDSSKRNLQAKRHGDEPEREMEEVIGQVLYGTQQLAAADGSRSVIAHHNLLADLFGDGDRLIATCDAVNPAPFFNTTPLNASQCVVVRFTFSSGIPQPIPNYYAGRVITFTNGTASGISTRVIAYFRFGVPYPDSMNAGMMTSSGSPELIIESPESDLPIGVVPNVGSRFIINGAPFNGTGAGFLAGGDNLDAMVSINGTDYPVAYLPNAAFYPAGSPDPAAGGLDEPYDIPDYQNIFLAFVPPTKLQGPVPPRTSSETTPPLPILPSFHRPDLVRYWRAFLYGTLLSGVALADQRNAFLYPYGFDGYLGTADDWSGLSPVQAQEVVTLKRMFIFRPLREDHPNFTGGNSNFLEDKIACYENDTNMNSIGDVDDDGDGVYDVDNDGDGIAESIWIDPGLSVVTAPNGRRYKRLVAICIKDLDGRVNPNVHGNYRQLTIANDAENPTSTANAFVRTKTAVAGTIAGRAPNTNTYLPRGQGYGPAEVDFMHMFRNASNVDDEQTYANILAWRYSSSVEFYPRDVANGGPGLYPGLNGDDTFSIMKTLGMPDNHNVFSPLTGYATPPDVWGRGAMALDYLGQPVWANAGFSERFNDPYEIEFDPTRSNADAPYNVSEFEALLRYHDQGTSVIASRLMGAAGNNYLATESRGTPGASQIRRESLGFGSSIPAPKFMMPRELRDTYSAGLSSTILDLYWAELSDPSEMQTMVPFEFFKGQMFDINRPFGNGTQDHSTDDPFKMPTMQVPNPTYTIDDPSEVNVPEPLPQTSSAPARFWTSPTAKNYDPYNDAALGDPRQVYARHLYCLMMLVRNRNYDVSVDLNADGATNSLDTARYYAQWAVNVVDFRDPDAIMTGFEYDATPLDGWSVDGDLSTTADQSAGGIVWGCERPELLITETISWHDRRTEDKVNDQFNGADNGQTTTDNGGGNIGEKDSLPPTSGPNDFDQRLLPRGALFVELYNPWFDVSSGARDHKPPELYDQVYGGVELHRVSAGGSPVWRLLIVKGASMTSDPDSPSPEQLNASADADRSVYFANQTQVTVAPTGDGEKFYPPDTIVPAPVLPGRYAMIGSAEAVSGGVYSTYVGRNTAAAEGGGLDLGNTRRFELRPNSNPNSVAMPSGSPSQFRIFSNSQTYTDDTTNDFVLTDFQGTVAIPINQPRSLSLTVPTGGYTVDGDGMPLTTPLNPAGADGEGEFSPPYDKPFDQVPELKNNLTSVNYRKILLQRLANPLKAWNQQTNPYLTVDSSSVDLTSFNGADATTDPEVMTSSRNFQTFQRGGPFPDAEVSSDYPQPASPNPQFRNIWNPQAVRVNNPMIDSPAEDKTVVDHRFGMQLFHTFGYINRQYHPYFGQTAAAAAPAYLGAPYYASMGSPLTTFPWLNFNNRPFNNPMELMQVPCWHSSKLLENFSIHDATSTTWTNQYLNTVADEPYGHLLNFFQTASGVTFDDGPEISRLLDYVEVPSPYVGTEKFYNPDYFLAPQLAPAGFRPPFNKLSRFRDPGKININTIFTDYVWNAAVHGSPILCALPSTDSNGANTYEGDDGTFLLRLLLSRQGYGTSGSDLLQHDPDYPSLFFNPFRTGDSADLLPLPSAALRKVVPDGTLLRRDTLYEYGNANEDPNKPMFASMSPDAHEDVNRNPYFRYQAYQKVGNVFSTNSNCYAVWITMGYFEVEGNDADNDPTTPFAIDAAHPDGLRLAQEVGVDTGEVKRHRAFYIIDRSIPVGYEPGHRHNTDKAVLLKRFIE